MAPWLHHQAVVQLEARKQGKCKKESVPERSKRWQRGHGRCKHIIVPALCEVNNQGGGADYGCENPWENVQNGYF